MFALLSSIGIDAQPYASASDFLNTFVDGQPAQQCVIVDLRMPDMDGIELKQELVSRGSQVPVLLLTGFCTPEVKAQAQVADIFDILEKPCHPNELEATIRRAFEASVAS